MALPVAGCEKYALSVNLVRTGCNRGVMDDDELIARLADGDDVALREPPRASRATPSAVPATASLTTPNPLRGRMIFERIGALRS
jgi:hypothetical protein